MPTTLDPSYKGASVTLSDGNLTAAFPAAGTQTARATTYKTTGKWYFEITGNWTQGGPGAGRIPGIMTLAAPATITFPGTSGSQSYGLFYDFSNWYVYFNSGSTLASATDPVDGDFVGVALDLNNNLLYFTLNGASLLGDPSAGTGGQAIFADTWFAAVGGGNNTSVQATANFGATSFGNRLPTGFLAWDQPDVQFIAVSTNEAAIKRTFRVVGV